MSSFRWAIFSCGKISEDFGRVIHRLPQHEISAVSNSRGDESVSRQYCEKLELPDVKTFGNLTELIENKAVFDAVYIGAITSKHFEITKVLLENGINVLCEKPLTMSEANTNELFDLAEKHNALLCENVWSRFFPVYERIKTIIDAGSLGELVSCRANFHVPICDLPRLRQKELGGGAVYDIGIYCLNLANFVFGGEIPVQCQVPFSVVTSDTSAPVDLASIAVLQYRGERCATLSIDTRAGHPEVSEAALFFRHGHIHLDAPFWCPTSFVIHDYRTDEKQVVDLGDSFPIDKSGFNFINSAGFSFIAGKYADAVKRNVTDGPVSRETSCQLAKQMDTIIEMIHRQHQN